MSADLKFDAHATIQLQPLWYLYLWSALQFTMCFYIPNLI